MFTLFLNSSLGTAAPRATPAGFLSIRALRGPDALA